MIISCIYLYVCKKMGLTPLHRLFMGIPLNLTKEHATLLIENGADKNAVDKVCLLTTVLFARVYT